MLPRCFKQYAMYLYALNLGFKTFMKSTCMFNHQKPHHICQVATQLFLEKGFDQVTISEIAVDSQCTEAEVYTLFGNKQDIMLFLYQQLNVEWKSQTELLQASNLSDRFEQAIKIKIDLISPYAALLTNMMGLLLNNQKLSIHSPRTSHIRAIGLQTMKQLIDASSDGKKLHKKVEGLPSLLYLMHWAALFLFVQSNDKTSSTLAIKLMTGLLQKANQVSYLLKLFPFLNDAGHLADTLLHQQEKTHSEIDIDILKIIFNHRKLSTSEPSCENNTCNTCIDLHIDHINYFTSQQQAIHFILPAFPAKSPNRKKVLGSLPDLGEEIALKTLDDLCEEIRSIYPPGAFVTICSDGRIFSELVGVSDNDITAYVLGIKQMIQQLNLQHVNIVNLEDLMAGDSFNVLRDRVISNYAESLDDLSNKLKTSDEFKSLFNGIHRFIVEDRKEISNQLSLSKIKEESKLIALKVIQHSNAWTRFLSTVFPEAFRLSIHPYPPHSEKTGIQLTKSNNNWLTPWHGVIVFGKHEYTLMKKDEAERMGATLVYKDARPYYYTLNTQG